MAEFEIRRAKEQDKNQILDLWKYCFSDANDEFNSYYFSQRFKPEHTVVLFREKNLEAALQLNPYNLVIGDVVCEVNYVVGVTVQPESRGRGYMSELIGYTLNEQYRNGEDFSILMPIDTKIYTRYGYANCFFKHEFLVDTQMLESKKSACRLERMNVANSENLEKELHNLNKIYYEVVAENHSYISRNTRSWKNKFAEYKLDGAEFFLVYEGKEVTGYVVFTVPKTPDGIAHVLEMGFGNREAYYAIVGLLRSHATQFKRARIATPQFEEFEILNSFNNQMEHRVLPFMMGRVINAEKVLDMILYKKSFFCCEEEEAGCECSQQLAIEIRDEIIKENNLITICDGRRVIKTIRLEEGADLSELPERRIMMTVSELAQLYMKAVSLRKLHRTGKVQIKNATIECFENLFGNRVRPSFINEYI